MGILSLWGLSLSHDLNNYHYRKMENCDYRYHWLLLSQFISIIGITLFVIMIMIPTPDSKSIQGGWEVLERVLVITGATLSNTSTAHSENTLYWSLNSTLLKSMSCILMSKLLRKSWENFVTSTDLVFSKLTRLYRMII